MSTAASPAASDPEGRVAQAIVVMGVCGCGKSTVGAALAEALGYAFQDGDDLHSDANVAKMAAGQALGDADRWPWLDAVGQALRGGGEVVACSALKQTYRTRIAEAAGRPVTFLHLTGPRALLQQRMAERQGHYMPASLLESQLDALEPPGAAEGAVTLSVDQPVAEIVAEALQALRLETGDSKDRTFALGVMGLGVMGRNLALNLRDQGQAVAAYDAWEAARDWRAERVTVCDTPAAFIAALTPPRAILMMVQAGQATDEAIAALTPLLEPGDVLLDGGNAFYRDTERRSRALRNSGIGYLGIGISGGAEGARRGASMMAGGRAADWRTLQPVLCGLAAKAEGQPCLAWFGSGGAGHFVKMVHNGIEYAVMQAIAEAYALLKGPLGLSPAEAGAVFADWAEGPLGGYLMEITAEILTTDDPETRRPMVEVIDDVAGQKGTGAWCAAAGIDYGVPLPTIQAALTARQVSARPALRQALAAQATPPPAAPNSLTVDHVQRALGGSILTALAEGLQLVQAANRENGWVASPGDVARVWRAGSILRMKLLQVVIDAPNVPHLFLVPAVAAQLQAWRPDWRRAVAAAVESGIPAPVFTASRAYTDALEQTRLPTALIQAQRDRFGAHGFGRVDKEGRHHGPWGEES